MKYVINKYQPEDVPKVLLMHHQSWLDTYQNKEAGVTADWINERFKEKFTEEAIEDKKRKVTEQLEDENHLALVAKLTDGQPIGFIIASKNGNSGEVNAIYIAKKYYGCGLSKDLMDRALDFLHGVKPVYIHVASYNERAKNFYRKFGFIEHGEPCINKIPQIPEQLMIRNS